MYILKRYGLISFLLLSPFIINQYLVSAQHDEYISITASIDARRFISLQSAYKELSPEMVKQLHLHTTPIDIDHYHMTLIGYDIYFGTTNLQKSFLKEKISNAMEVATIEAIKKVLHTIKHPITLRFEHIEIFNKFVVGIFMLTDDIEMLLENIKNEFKKQIQSLLDNDTIVSIKPQYPTFKPHVSLARITDRGDASMGMTLMPKTRVKDFKISFPRASISTQWRVFEANQCPSAP